MVTNAIAFEINIPREGIKEEFLVLNTDANYEKICAHRFTRQIKIVEVERFNSKMRMPAEFMNPVFFFAILARDYELAA